MPETKLDLGKIFPLKKVENLIVHDWAADHDSGDEDDGLIKAMESYLKEHGKAS